MAESSKQKDKVNRNEAPKESCDDLSEAKRIAARLLATPPAPHGTPGKKKRKVAKPAAKK